jgi:pimeloyl-ACP methyl ester carboxylesterase
MATAAATRAQPKPPGAINALVDRFDLAAFDLPGSQAVIRLADADGESWDVLVDRTGARLTGPAGKGNPDALLTADEKTWERLGRDVTSGMRAFRAGRLDVRRNLHLGVGFLAATAPDTGPGRFRFARVRTKVGEFSTIEAGTGEPVIMLHGLGGTKASFLPTIAALSDSYRLIAVDMLGFGDSSKPLGASYGPAFQAGAVEQLMDALELQRAHLIGHSFGGRAALELGFRHPDRAAGLVLMTPALAWLRDRRWAPYLRLVRPELGLLQIAPRGVVEALMRWAVPADTPWAAAAIDEFVRIFATARGRAAFYAAARHVYLDEPHGANGFWTQLETLAPESLFIWGTHDRLVPTAFIKHVERALPAARHVELECGHIPQIESPRQAHAAIADFLGTQSV